MTFDEIYADLLEALDASGRNIDPSCGDGEAFFGNIIATFPGTKAECLAYITRNISNWFRVVGDAPDWIQGCEWPYWQGKPMVFVGQVNVPRSAGWLHDDAAFYTFWEPEAGVTETVVQVS